MFDVLFQNAMILDGTGRDPYAGDLAVSQGKISAMGDLSGHKAQRTVDLQGRFLTPGFIDIHRHGELAVFRPGYGDCELAQGLTTVINGNCGLSAIPWVSDEFAQYLSPITGSFSEKMPDFKTYFQKQQPFPLHQGLLVGGGTLRAMVAGFDPSPLTQGQIKAMQIHLKTALDQGALGVSLGLGYAPECFYSLDELTQVLEPLSHGTKVISVHLRQEGDGVVAALEEMIALARRLHAPIQVSHLKAIGNRGHTMETMLSMIGQAQQEGVDIAWDVYPYTAGSTQLLHVLPPEIQEGGMDNILSSLSDETCRLQLKKRMETGTDFENIIRLVGFESVHVTGLHQEELQPYEGKTLVELAKIWNCDPYTALFDILLKSKGTATMIDFIAREEDMRLALQTPGGGIISDATYPDSGRCHPRVYGTFARLLETYVNKEQVLSLPQAIHKITLQPAKRYGLSNKGCLAVGMDADVCAFYLESIHEVATFDDPAQLSQGMDYVMVSGVLMRS